jgi:hypothetical protein
MFSWLKDHPDTRIEVIQWPSLDSLPYVVYWTEDGSSMSMGFDAQEMNAALAKCEDLRKRKANGEDIKHICLSSEDPNSVTKMGVDVTDETYDWRKRR